MFLPPVPDSCHGLASAVRLDDSHHQFLLTGLQLSWFEGDSIGAVRTWCDDGQTLTFTRASPIGAGYPRDSRENARKYSHVSGWHEMLRRYRLDAWSTLENRGRRPPVLPIHAPHSPGVLRAAESAEVQLGRVTVVDNTADLPLRLAGSIVSLNAWRKREPLSINPRPTLIPIRNVKQNRGRFVSSPL